MTTRTTTFTVSLSQDHANVVTVHYATYSNTAIDGQDFTGVSGTLTFNPGELTKTVAVTIQAVSDRDLYFGIALSSVENCTLSASSNGSATIKADNTLSALVADYHTKMSAYTAAYNNYISTYNYQQSALGGYNYWLSTYNNAVANANAQYNNAVNAQNVTNNKLNIYNIDRMSSTISAYVTMAAYNDYIAAKAVSDAAWNSSNIANSQRDSAASSLNDATNNLNWWNAAFTAALNAQSSAATIANTARSTAASHFVGSTSLQS